MTSGSAFVVSGVVGTSFAEVDGPPVGASVGATVSSVGASDVGAEDGGVVSALVVVLDAGLVVLVGSGLSSLPHAVSAPSASNAVAVTVENLTVDRWEFMGWQLPVCASGNNRSCAFTER